MKIRKNESLQNLSDSKNLDAVVSKAHVLDISDDLFKYCVENEISTVQDLADEFYNNIDNICNKFLLEYDVADEIYEQLMDFCVEDEESYGDGESVRTFDNISKDSSFDLSEFPQMR